MGVVGLTIALIGITIGIGALLFFKVGFLAWAHIVAGLFLGWVSFLYCVVWGESH